MSKVQKLAIAAVLMGGASAGFAFADREDVRALEAAQVSLVQAIQAAEAHQNGKAYEAQIDDDSFRPEYEVSVVADGRIYDVRVDAETGEVIGSREERDD